MSSPVRSGKVTVIHDAAPVAKLIDDVRTGISHLKVLEALPSGVGQMRATVWPGERPIADGPEVTLRDVAGQAWLAARIREEQPDVVFIPEQVMRMASPASWPDHEALADIVSALEPVAAETGAAVVIAHPPATPLPTAPKKAKASRRIATGIERGKVTRFEAGADVATLVTALVAPGGRVWQGTSVGGGDAVVLGSGGQYSCRLVATLHEARTGRAFERVYRADRDSVPAARWVGDLLTEGRSTAALIVTEDVLAAGEHDARLKLNLAELARAHDVAVVVQ